jgi:NADPH:quinone reductase-like Zn-dependent oxidoreductase
MLTGLNWPSRVSGVEAHQRLLEMVRDGEIRTVVTSTVPFDGLPEAMERQERRETTGRTVITLT